MQFDFDSALMGYGAGQKFTSAGDAVVPSLTPRVSGFSQYPFSMQSSGSGFDKAAYDLPLKPLYEISGTSCIQTSTAMMVVRSSTLTVIYVFVCRRRWGVYKLSR